MSEHIRFQQQKNIGIISINRPEKKNALTQAMYQQLHGYLSEAESNNDIQAILIHGEGGNFTSGNDITDFQNVTSPKDLAAVLGFLKALTTIKKPLIAAVEGYSIGVGTTLLLHCDLVYAHKNTIFQTPFAALGLCPEAGASLLMPAMLGYHNAVRLLMLGDKINGVDAKDMGLVTEVVDNAPFNYALDKALQIASYPKHAINISKQLIKQSLNQEMVQNVMDVEAKLFFECLQQPETQARLKGFSS